LKPVDDENRTQMCTGSTAKCRVSDFAHAVIQVCPGDLANSSVWEAPPVLKPTGSPGTVDLSHFCNFNIEKQPKPPALSLLEMADDTR
jgi:hypothetical protein